MDTALRYQTSTNGSQHPALNYHLSAINYQLSAINTQLPALSSQHPDLSSQLLALNYKLSAFSPQPSALSTEEINWLADLLFKIGAVKFGAFRLKLHETQPDAPLSPIYLNFRLLRSYPQELGYTAQLLLKVAKSLSFDLLADIPTGVTPVVAVMAYLSGYPMISPRKDSKSYGLGVAIDGDYQPGQRVLLVDDVISGGDSKFEALEKLEKAGLVAEDLLIIIDREQGGAQTVRERGYKPHCLATISQLLTRYRQTGAIDQTRYEEVISYLGIGESKSGA